MKELFREYLFKHNVLVSDKKYDDAFFTNYALVAKFGIHIRKGKDLANIEHIKFAAEMLGEDVPTPFYQGFPESVKKLSTEEYLIDQLYSYWCTYGLQEWDEARHSIFESEMDKVRTKFIEKVEPKYFDIVTEDEAIQLLKEYYNDACAGSRPLNPDMYNAVTEFMAEYNWMPTKMGSKNTVMKFLLDHRKTYFAKFLVLADVLKVVELLTNCDNKPVKKLNKLNLTNKDRKFISSIIDKLVETCKDNDFFDCFERKKHWAGLLHHIHYTPKTDKAIIFCNAMRGKGNLSNMARFESYMAKNLPAYAAEHLKSTKGVSAVMRHLNYLISRCRTNEELESVVNSIDGGSAIVYLQLIQQYYNYVENKEPRTFTFIKNGLTKRHVETADEVQRRKSMLYLPVVDVLKKALLDKVQKLYKGALGKVYVEESFKNIALPLYLSSGNLTLGALTCGTKIQLPEIGKKKVRAFVYWEKVNDIDLSCIALTENCETVHEFSWRTMYREQENRKEERGVLYSGDETSGFCGGSEYFDINVNKLRKSLPSARYLVFSANSYSGDSYKNVVCKAGYMLRDEQDSGEVYEPKTVQTSFTVDCDSTYATLFALDLTTNELIWLNINLDSQERVAGESEQGFLKKYLTFADRFNVKWLAESCATEVVDNYTSADVIFSDSELEIDSLAQIQIKSTDVEYIMKLMENKK